MIRSINPFEAICAGETVSFEAEVTGVEEGFAIVWGDKYMRFVDVDSEHYSLSENKTVLTINNALPPHAGIYFAHLNLTGILVTYTVFYLDVHGI